MPDAFGTVWESTDPDRLAAVVADVNRNPAAYYRQAAAPLPAAPAVAAPAYYAPAAAACGPGGCPPASRTRFGFR